MEYLVTLALGVVLLGGLLTFGLAFLRWTARQAGVTDEQMWTTADPDESGEQSDDSDGDRDYEAATRRGRLDLSRER